MTITNLPNRTLFLYIKWIVSLQEDDEDGKHRKEVRHENRNGSGYTKSFKNLVIFNPIGSWQGGLFHRGRKCGSDFGSGSDFGCGGRYLVSGGEFTTWLGRIVGKLEKILFSGVHLLITGGCLRPF